MKNLMIYCFFSLIYSSGCEQKKNAKGDQLPKYPKEKQISHIAHMNSKTPYELYLDNQLVDWEL